jgi:selenocysteine-specific elongation factor
MTPPGPLTLGTAGHIDHGKTALVSALTGVDTDRLPEERARGISIVLGYAPLRLPSGRAVSVVDVPGHERFVRTMVAGATGIDCFLMVVAADDGVMPQTVEHAAVLRGLGVSAGVVAVTKADLIEPGPAAAQARELLPHAADVGICSARTGAGVAEVAAALDRLAATLPGRAMLGSAGGPTATVLHIDRAFVIAGRGTVVTGTLWAGELGVGDTVELLPSGQRVRVRGVQVHDREFDRAVAGQRVAANLAGVRAREVGRGDVLATPGLLAESTVLDCVLALRDARHGERVHVHHGTREAPARLCALEENLWQLRLERPVLASAGDRVIVRRLSPPDTLGGGTVLDAGARRHGPRPDVVERLRRLRDGIPDEPDSLQHAADAPPSPKPAVPSPAALALEQHLRGVGMALLSESAVDDGRALRALREANRAVRVAGRLYAHTEVVADVRTRVVELIQRDGAITLAALRDELGTSRKSAQAFLEHFDAERVTRRLPDNRRVLARRGRE